jgi:amino acid transporter
MAEETEKQRVDREVIELLNELRVTLPGVQVLFGFLLILPFQQRFADLSQPERAIYIVAVVATVAALICLIAPASYHRLRFRATDKQRMLFIGNRLAIAGVAFLAVALMTGLFLITEVVIGDAWGAVLAAAAGLGMVLLWFALPLYNKYRSGDR